MINRLKKVFNESIISVLPILLIVVILSFFVDFTRATLFSFGISMLLIIMGITLFTFGTELSMEMIGEKIGENLVKKHKFIPAMFLIFIIGIIVTIAEPDLKILSDQMTYIPSFILMLTVGIGVGGYLLFAFFKTKYNINIIKILIFTYIIIFSLLLITPIEFIPLAFDSGGVTTGPVSAPFILALGLGLASVNIGKKEKENSFGLIALCSAGPILVVLLLGLIFEIDSTSTVDIVKQYESAFEVIKTYLSSSLIYLKEIVLSIGLIVLVYSYFQYRYKITNRFESKKVVFGLIVTILGLSLYLLGANVGLMPIGSYIGRTVGLTIYKWLLIPLGMVIGFISVKAEPAIKLLNSKIEDITEGAIKKNIISTFLSIGAAIAVGLAILRALTGVSILYIIVPGYLLIIILTFIVPTLFTSIAFDSGGVAAGPITATFMLPLTIGASISVGGNPMTDAFGLVALVAMAPLIMIQLLGLIYKLKEKYRDKHRYHTEIVEYDWSD